MLENKIGDLKGVTQKTCRSERGGPWKKRKKNWSLHKEVCGHMHLAK